MPALRARNSRREAGDFRSGFDGGDAAGGGGEQVEVLLREHAAVEVALDVTPAASAHPLGESGIGEDLFDRGAEGADVFRLGEEAGSVPSGAPELSGIER